jgi:hypothetical protein
MVYCIRKAKIVYLVCKGEVGIKPTGRLTNNRAYYVRK